MDEIFSWRLYDFSPDQLSFINTTRIMEGPTGHSLLLDGNSSHIQIDSVILNNSNHVIFSAKIKPRYTGASHYTILSSSGFEFGLKNVDQKYYAELSIYNGKDWRTIQSTKPIKEEWSYVFGFYDGKTMMIDTNGEIKEIPILIQSFPDILAITGENFTSNFDKDGQTKLHFDIGASLSHLGYFDYFSGQIDDMLVYPTNVQNLTQLVPEFTFTNATTPANVTAPIVPVFTFTNVTAPANVTAVIPTNVTAPANVTAVIPTNMTANQILENATTYLNFSQNSIQGLGSEGSVQLKEGLNGTALELQGSGLVTASMNETNTLTGLTVSAWVKPNYEEGSNVFTVASKERSFLLQINNKILPQRVASFSIFDGIQWHTVESNSTIGEEWTHVVGTFDGKEIGLYVNGQKEAFLPVAGIGMSLSGHLQVKNVTSLQSSADVLIGAEETKRGDEITVKNLFSGSIDEFSIYRYQLKDDEIAALFEQGAASKEQLDISTLPVVPDIKALKTNYLITENPKFEFQFYSDNELKTVVKKIKPSLEPVQHDGWQKGNENVNVDVVGPDGKKIPIRSEFKKLREGKFDIQFGSERAVTPGLYKLKITLIKDGKTYTSETQFAWGLVSLNTAKSIYRPGETADLIIVVLDNTGKSVCNATISMKITDPKLQSTLLSSGSGITPGSECGLYDAHYVTSSEGNYTIDVTAKNPSGITSFSTYFTVQQNFNYDIVRTTQSKIDPFDLPNNFNVKIDLKSFVGSSPVTIKEYVPSVFNVVTDGTISQMGDTKVITWNKSLDSTDSTVVSYNYSVPLIQPQLYALGKVEVDQNNQPTFIEARNWFVAVDANRAYTINDNGIGTDANALTIYTWSNMKAPCVAATPEIGSSFPANSLSQTVSTTNPYCWVWSSPIVIGSTKEYVFSSATGTGDFSGTAAISGTIPPAVISTMTATYKIHWTSTLSETLALSDSTSSFKKSIVQPLPESLGLSDQLTKNPIMPLPESLQLSDQLTKTISKSLPESLQLSDQLTKTISKSLPESLGLSDQLTKNPIVLLPESLTSSDEVTPIKSKNANLPETLALSDSTSSFKKTGITLSDTFSSSDSSTFQKSLVQPLSETLALSD
ncbi:MAG: hypothetical protein KGI10_07505, partial [Thaumarchaeota archaeon]|nr:hypothetical protein [Nitrososphaerota archaeon]